MIELTISGNSYEEALEEGMKQLGVSKDAVEVEELSNAHDDILPGAEPLPGVTLRFRVREEVILRQARNHLVHILDLIGIRATVESFQKRRGPTLDVVAPDDGSLIIGKNGQNLEAFQYLINRMTVRSNRELAPIIVDSEGYREKRLTKLEDLARRTARRVLKSGREISLEPMPAGERKAIHIAVKEIRGIHSISRGEEAQRHVVITPAEGEAPSPHVHRGRRPGGRPEGERRGGGGGGRFDRSGGEGGGYRGGPRGGGRPDRGPRNPNRQPPPPRNDPPMTEEEEDSRFNR